MDTAFRASIAGTMVLEPPISPTHHLSALAQRAEAEIEARARTHEIHHRRGAAAVAFRKDFRVPASRVDHVGRARLARQVPPRDRVPRRWRPRCTAGGHPDAGQPHAAGAQDQQRIVERQTDLPCAVRDQSGAARVQACSSGMAPWSTR